MRETMQRLLYLKLLQEENVARTKKEMTKSWLNVRLPRFGLPTGSLPMHAEPPGLPMGQASRGSDFT